MAQQYYGTPTRTGRIMMAIFGAPFVLAAIVLLGIALFGANEGGEILGRLAFGVGAVFLIVITVIGWWKYLTGRW